MRSLRILSTVIMVTSLGAGAGAVHADGQGSSSPDLRSQTAEPVNFGSTGGDILNNVHWDNDACKVNKWVPNDHVDMTCAFKNSKSKNDKSPIGTYFTVPSNKFWEFTLSRQQDSKDLYWAERYNNDWILWPANTGRNDAVLRGWSIDRMPVPAWQDLSGNSWVLYIAGDAARADLTFHYCANGCKG